MIVASFLVLLYLVPMMLQADPPPVHSTDAKYRELERKGEAIMIVLDTLSPANMSTRVVEREWGASYLERLIALRHARPDDAGYQWEGDLDWVYTDPGTFKQLAIGKPPNFRTLFGEKYGDPRGERVTTTRHLDPKWNRVHAQSVTDPLDGATPVTFQAGWVNSSRLARQPGDVVRFNATMDSTLATGRNLETYGLVAQSGTATPATTTLRWTRIAGKVPDAGTATVTPTGLDAGIPQDFWLDVSCTAGGAQLKAGVLVTFHAERGIGSLTHVEGSDWVAHGPVRTHSDGSEEITFRRTSSQPCNGAPTTVSFVGTLSPTAPAFVRVHAYLHEGAMARSTAVVRYLNGNPDPTQPREILITAPYAVQPGATARLGATFVNGAEPTVITNFTISIPGGYDFRESDGQGANLFAGIAAAPQPDPASGARACADGSAPAWKRVSARELAWCGELSVAAHATASFAVDVTFEAASRTRHGRASAGTAYASGELGYWNQSLKLPNGHEAYPMDGPGAWMRAPGLARFRVPAAVFTDPDAGYPTTTAGGGQLGENTGVRARLHRLPYAAQEGPSGAGGSFELAASVPGLASLEGAILNSSAAPRERIVRAGGAAVVDVDFSNVMRELRAAGNVVNLKRYFEVYGPANPSSVPFLRVEGDVSATPPLPVRHLATGDLVAGGNHEIAVSAADGFVHALDPLSVNGAPPRWSARVTSSGNGEAYRAVVADVSPLVAGTDLLALSLNGDVTLTSGATGERAWASERLFARAYDLAFDRAATRVIAAGRDETTTNLALAWLNPDTGATTATYQMAGTPNMGGYITPFTGATPLDRRVAVAAADGRTIALDTAGSLVWSYTAPLPVGGVLAVTSGNYDGNTLNGDEVAVAFGHRVVLLSSAGTLVREWVAPSNGAGGLVQAVAASADASVTGTPGPEIAWAGDDQRIRLLDMNQATPLLWTANAPGAENVGTALPKAAWLQEWDLDAGSCLHSDLGDSLQCALPTAESLPRLPGNAAVPSTRVTALAILTSEAPPAARVIVGGFTASDAGEAAYVTAFEAANGATASGWTPREIPGEETSIPTALAQVARNPIPSPVEPYVAIGTQDGSVYLQEWSGDSAWSPPASPSASAGAFTYMLDVDRATLLGTYVTRAGLTWTRGSLHQEASLLDWLEVQDEQGWSADDPYVIQAHLSAWQGEWDQ